jgi:hypothetical protein
MPFVLINRNDNSIHDVVATAGERWGIPFGPPGAGGADFLWVSSPDPVEHTADWSYDGRAFSKYAPPVQIVDPNPTAFEVLQWMIDNGVITTAQKAMMPQSWRDNLEP